MFTQVDYPLLTRKGLVPTQLVEGSASPPRRLRWGPPLIAAALALALLGGLLNWWLGSPTQLGQAELVGSRGPGCLRLVIAADTSGSMSTLTEPRDNAVAQVLAWVPGNLRPDDEVVLIDFAGGAARRLGPTPVSEQFERQPGSPDPTGTNFVPVLGAVEQLPAGRCRTGLLLISDGAMHDLPATEPQATAQLTAAGVHDIRLIVPGITEVNPNWRLLYPTAKPQIFDGNDSAETALVIGRNIGDMTGQELRRTTAITNNQGR